MICSLLLAAFTLAGAPAPTDWRVVAVDQNTTNAVIVSGAPGAKGEILWRWDPAKDPGLKGDDAKRFRAIDECKPRNGGKTVLVNASLGGVAEIDVATAKAKWYTKVTIGCDGAHSSDILPDGRIAVANSVGCDALEIVDLNGAPLDPSQHRLVRAADICGAHGVVWDKRRQSLFVLGYTNLYEFAYEAITTNVKELHRWRYVEAMKDGRGHDLVPDPYGGYFLTNHSGVWHFDPRTEKFSPVRTVRHAKSFSRDSVKGDVMQVAREKWWSDRIVVVDPDGTEREIGPFPGAKFYKARWMQADGGGLNQ